MTALIDRLLLCAISILMIDVNQVDYKTVCLILIVIIMETMIIYFGDEKVIKLVNILFILLSLFQTDVSAFYPLLLYECTAAGLFYLIPLNVLGAIITHIVSAEYNIFSNHTFIAIVCLSAGMIIGYKFAKEKALKEKLHEVQDEESFLNQKNRRNHDELVKKQDSEIHAATLAERNRIAREIHDHVGHMLSRSILQLGAILAINKDEKLDVPLRGMKDTLDTAMNNIRESVHDLKDDSMDLQLMVNNVVEQYKELSVELDYDMGQSIPKELKYCFIAILKEALTNTVKHSDSTRVCIVMREHPALYQVLIEDNGSNSNAAIKKLNDVNGKPGIGLENMRERISAFGGNISFSGNSGFKIFITVPRKFSDG